MKKLMSAVLIFCILLLCACSTRPAVKDTDETLAPEPTNMGQPKEEAAFEIVYKNAIVYKSSIGAVWLQVIVQIKNIGTEPLCFVNATLDLENEDGSLFRTLQLCSAKPDIVKPGETALIVENKMLDEDPGIESLNVVPHIKGSKPQNDCIRLSTSEERLFLVDGPSDNLRLTGRVENTTDKAQNMVYVIANLYDSEHHAIGQLFTVITDEIQPGEKIEFDLTTVSVPDSVNPDSVASFEVFAFPEQLQFSY